MSFSDMRKNYHRTKKLGIQYPKNLTPGTEEDIEFIPMPDKQKPDKLWVSRKYLVLYFEESHPDYPGLIRLSICRVKRNQHGWADGLTWDDLNAIKDEIGLGDSYAVEIFPRNRDIVNVANFRHLWVLQEPLSIGWFKSDKSAL